MSFILYAGYSQTGFFCLKLEVDLAHPGCPALPEPHSKYSVVRNNRTCELYGNSGELKRKSPTEVRLIILQSTP